MHLWVESNDFWGRLMFSQSIKRWADRTWLPWVVWAVGSCFIAYQYSFQTSAAIMVSQLMHAFHLSEAGVGFLSSTFFYTYLLMQIPAGILLDHCSYRRLLLFSIFLFIIGLLMFSVTSSLTVAIIARLLMGLASAPAVAAALCLASNWFSASMFVLIVGLTEMIGMLGALFGEGYMAQWVDQLGWRHSLWVWLAFGLVLWLATAYWVYDAPTSTEASPKPVIMGWRDCFAKVKQSLLEVMGDMRIWLNGVFCGLTFAVNSAFAGLWAVPFCQSVFHLSIQTSAWVVSAFFIGVMIGGACLSLVTTLFQCRNRLMRWASLGMALSTIPFIVLSSYPHLVGDVKIVLAVFFLLMGVFSSIYIMPFANIRDLVSPRARGTAMAFTNTACIAIGAPLLQPLFGMILHRFHAASVTAIQSGPATVHAFQCCLLVLIACALLAWYVARVLKSGAHSTATGQVDDFDTSLEGITGSLN